MPENKYERLPQAGDTENEPGTEVFYLAPRPVPTGVAAFSSRSLHRDADSVYLDFGLSSATLEFAVRWYIGSLMSVVIIFQLIGLGLSIDDHFRFGKPLFELYLNLVLPNHFF
ncbi:hypothetical protein V2K07_26265, partial [Pseudomonas alliivorans]|nr:hypothetical protein [Pseudomonas alliivorans]